MSTAAVFPWNRGRAGRMLVTGGVLLLAAVCGRAQQIQFEDRGAEVRKAHVVLLTDAADVAAGSPQNVELRFRVDAGFHINSHTPKDEFLLRTELKLEPTPGVKLLEERYPGGTPFRLQMAGAEETLDVYQDEFRVRLRIVAQRGSAVLSGTLRYQACDSAACFPPRTLPVRVVVTGK